MEAGNYPLPAAAPARKARSAVMIIYAPPAPIPAEVLAAVSSQETAAITIQ
jgi:hypothetical protein